MRIIADLAAARLILPDAAYCVSNLVRTLRDRTRRSHEVVLSIPDNKPYDPRPFPKGLWRVTGLDWQREKGFDSGTYGPVKIRTDAWQHVNVWELDADGDYLRETEKQVQDLGYWLHYSASVTTLGCIRFARPEDAIGAAEAVAEALKHEGVELEVV
ncbi:MAG: hypothetical protein LBQ35_07050 [Spirochaetaceae bacterium]|jgi:hypothetical protein|nr:hypothetical protein [Spirochaetaceae bacterium]